MIKILTACGTGINSSTQIKNAIVKEMKTRGYEVKADTTVLSNITKEMIEKYDIFCPISKIDLSFKTNVPIVVCGPILYRIPSMAEPIYDEIESIIKAL